MPTHADIQAVTNKLTMPKHAARFSVGAVSSVLSGLFFIGGQSAVSSLLAIIALREFLDGARSLKKEQQQPAATKQQGVGLLGIFQSKPTDPPEKRCPLLAALPHAAPQKKL